MQLIKVSKSVYDKPEESDGERILVMRMWPRGVSRPEDEDRCVDEGSWN